MAYLIDDITQYLEGQLGATIGTNLFTAYMPDSIDDGVCVIDTGGPQLERELPIRSATFQVFIRASTYAAGKIKLDAIHTALHGYNNTQINNTYFYYILAQSAGGHIGRNERGLDEFSINFICLTR